MSHAFDQIYINKAWSVYKIKEGYKACYIKKEVHNYDEYAKNDETSTRFTKKYEENSG